MRDVDRRERGSWDEFRDIAKEVRFAMLSTEGEGGRWHARPMATQEIGADGCIWFVTGRDTHKVSQIEHEHEVGITYLRESDGAYATVWGRAEVVDDPQRLRRMWTPWMRAWFDGPGDPTLVLVRVWPREIEYWKPNAGRLGRLAKLLVASVFKRPLALGARKELVLGA